MQSLSHLRSRPLRGLVAALAATVLVGCGSDDTASTLGGVAAVGVPIAGGAVSVACAGGSPLNTTTSSSGQWQVTISGQTLPCAVQVRDGTVDGAPNTATLHSIAYTLGTVNITPLTDLVVARSIGGDPQAWFAAPSFTGLDAAKTQAALTQVASSLGLTSALNGRDPLTTPFQAVAGDAIDDALEALNAALLAVGSSYSALLEAAANGDFDAFASLPAAVTQALSGGTGGGTGGGSSGGTTLTLEITTSGMPVASVTVPGDTAPTSQDEFCTGAASDPSLSGLLAQSGITLTITGCSFANNVGTIEATATTSGVSLPYLVRFTWASDEGGASGTLSCETKQFATGTVATVPTAAEIAPFAKNYTSGANTVVLAANGGLTVNGKAITVASTCLVKEAAGDMLMLSWGAPMTVGFGNILYDNHIDFRSSGISGIADGVIL